MVATQTVFIVDDDEAVRDSLRGLLESVRLPAEVFASGQEFLDAYQPDRSGCVVLDVRMPGRDGLELLEELTRLPDSIPIIMITGHGDVPMAVRAMKAGAVDFVEKPYNAQVLLDLIRRALQRDLRLREQRQGRAVVTERMTRLTSREREVLELLVAGRSAKAIAAQLGISPKTVEGHRVNILEKMEADSAADLVRLVLQQWPARVENSRS